MVGVRNEKVLYPAVELCLVNQSGLLCPAAYGIGIDTNEGAIPSVVSAISRAGVAHECCSVPQKVQHAGNVVWIGPVGWITVPSSPAVKESLCGLHPSPAEHNIIAAGIF